MRLLFVAVLAASLIPAAASQNRPQAKSSYDVEEPAPPVHTYSPELMTELTSVRDAALNDDYAYRIVAHLSDNIGPRPAGSPQAQAAVEYVADQMRQLGLDVKLEPVKVPFWFRGAESAELVAYPGQAPGTTQKIVLTALGGNTPTPPTGLTADVVVVRNYDELNALGRQKVEGKVVLFNVLFDKQKAAAGYWGDAYGEAVDYRGKGPLAAAGLGAVACLVRSVGGAEFRSPHTGYSHPAGIPAGAVTAEDADLIAHLAAQGPVRIHFVLLSENRPEVQSYNVVGDLKGSEHPEQVVLVSGHLDSWDLGTGAIDDAAGVAVAMQTAATLQKLHLRPRRTIRVIAWMDEEDGGQGHDAYAVAHQPDIPNHVAAIESDLGADHPLGFLVKAPAAALPWLAPVQTVLASFGANLLKEVDFSPGADITPLSKLGVPTLGILQDGRTYFNYHHTAADTLDKIDPRQLRENAAAMAVMAHALASMDQPLPR